MKYFIDTEFIEGAQIKRFLGIPIGKTWKILDPPYQQTKPTIDLISIGIVAEEGREYYAISKDFNLKEAWNRYDIKSNPNYIPNFGGRYNPQLIKDYWIRDNVLRPIWDELKIKEYGGSITRQFSFNNLKWLINEYGKTNKQIAEEIKEFCSPTLINTENLKYRNLPIIKETYENPEFYGYYCDYDWVVFCWLFGKMIDLPKGFTMYCNDLKQTLDEKVSVLLTRENQRREFYKNELCIFDEALSMFKTRKNFPEQTDEHNALADAKWNKQLYDFLQKL